ncbi:UDP-N-acetylmuramate--L-alanine ligase [Schleiferilactobacillus shenzhenensis]|uniref:UDP-N-acetylmuramate--L-alanine ligase n=1 Tax=Schleiferilactobacillus shenzhenensis LY-73 TaxID=1231336 RepID=U4TYH1_9LACO|nr:UDP-N-acetylmuramate--L-alanine ligase [Schleiferilactobacillus shenzhenensis]ERL66357.1 MurC [Schleiferilactobacillus shenzhenensis LY-73]
MTKYYFIGIKGSGMSALALILHDLGNDVSGSDIDQFTFTQKPLAAAGIPMYPFDPANLHEGMTVIRGNAFRDDNPEIAQAKKMGLPMYRYNEFLGEFMKPYTSIGISGTHGKTSTTGLLAHTLSGVAKTSYLIGDGTGKGVPNARFFVYEADEYERHFVSYHPDYSVITNIDYDHPDYYKDIDDVVSAFQQEVDQTRKAVFAWGDDPHVHALHHDVPMYFYGLKDTDDFQAVNVQRTTKGSSFDVLFHKQPIGHYAVSLFGEHSILNSLAVIGVAHLERMDPAKVAAELESFQGVKRRFAETDYGSTKVIDDYAHHPNEIRATLDAARQKFPDRKIVAVFQPHTYTRTKALMPGFVKSLSQADAVYIFPIFGSVRESHGNVSSQDLADKIPQGATVLTNGDTTPLLKEQGNVLVFMGAGDIQKYEKQFTDALQAEK